MRRGTCQTWLSWHTNCSPNTYILLKKGGGQRDRQRTHCTAGYLLFFLTTYLGAWIDNCQRGAAVAILRQSLTSAWQITTGRWYLSLTQNHRFRPSEEHMMDAAFYVTAPRNLGNSFLVCIAFLCRRSGSSTGNITWKQIPPDLSVSYLL